MSWVIFLWLWSLAIFWKWQVERFERTCPFGKMTVMNHWFKKNRGKMKKLKPLLNDREASISASFHIFCRFQLQYRGCFFWMETSIGCTHAHMLIPWDQSMVCWPRLMREKYFKKNNSFDICIRVWVIPGCQTPLKDIIVSTASQLSLFGGLMRNSRPTGCTYI